MDGEGRLRFYGHLGLITIDGIDNLAVTIFQKYPSQIPGPGQLSFIRVKLLVEIDKLLYPGATR